MVSGIESQKSTPKKVKPSSILVKVGKKVRRRVDPILAASSKVGDRPVFDSAEFSFTSFLESKAEIIAREAKAVIEEDHGVHSVGEVSPDHGRIAHDRRWKSLFLIGYGYRMEHNCARCPETTKVLEQIPGLNSGFFSIMEPGTEIPRHRGVTKAVLTCHLGLMVPTERSACAIEVGDQTCHWESGKTLVFDDTFHHSAWNRTNESRVILLLQFERPMRFPGNLLGNMFLSGVRASTFVQEGRRNMVEKDRALGLDASSRRMR